MADRSSDRTFTPAEIDAVAGLSTGLQREWRRQKALPGRSDRGWMRADLNLVVEIFIQKRLADAGFPLKEARVAASSALPFLKAAISWTVAHRSSEASRSAQAPVEDPRRWMPDVMTDEMIVEAKLDRPLAPRYVVFARTGNREEPVDVAPINSPAEVRSDLVVWTMMDNWAAATQLIDGICTVRRNREAGG